MNCIKCPPIFVSKYKSIAKINVAVNKAGADPGYFSEGVHH